MVQLPAVQAAVALARLQTVPHDPQFDVSVDTFVSQPAVELLQSA